MPKTVSLGCSALLPLLLLGLVACGGEKENDDADRVDLRPRWRIGDTMTVREEREKRIGRGPYPPEGEILDRTTDLHQERRVYTLEVVEGVGPRLLRVRLTYKSSVRGKPGELAPDALAGKSFLVTTPFGKMRVEREEDGERVKASAAEAAAVGETALRLAASLLPADPVRVGGTWRPGRDLDVFARQGRGPIRMVPRFAGIEERGEGHYARIECETRASVKDGPETGAGLSMAETLFMDLDRARIASYHAVTQWRQPVAPRRREEWRRTTVDLSISP